MEVSNDTSTSYTQCAYRGDRIPEGQPETLQCDSPLIARYVRIRHLRRNMFTVCEVIVTGHRYISKNIISVLKIISRFYFQHWGIQWPWNKVFTFESYNVSSVLTGIAGSGALAQR